MLSPALTHIHETLVSIREKVKHDIIGQDDLVEKLIIGVFSNGHSLIEGVPGLGKTKTIRTLAHVLGLETKRVSFTPDLLPGDLTGNEIYRPQKGEFIVRKGPIFTHILLADEINRTPPKVQSALLEAMEERQVTIGEESFSLPTPFIVFATQNPLEHEGTYPLPEAELDRFLMRIVIDYPSKQDEQKMLSRYGGNTMKNSSEFLERESVLGGDQELSEASSSFADLGKDTSSDTGAYSTIYHQDEISINKEDISEMTDYIEKNIFIDEKIYKYVCDILDSLRALAKKTTDGQSILDYGPSTRAGLSLIRASKVRAVFMSRDFVLPEDIKHLAHAVLDHRIGLSYASLIEKKTSFQIVESVLSTVIVP